MLGGPSGSSGLVATLRKVPTSNTPATAAIDALLAGPSASERGHQITSAIPDGSKLLGLTISSNTVNAAKASFEAINKALKKAKDARSNLAPARKEQVESALKTLEGDVSGMGSELASDLTKANLESGLTKFKSAVGTFAADLNQAFVPLNCS